MQRRTAWKKPKLDMSARFRVRPGSRRCQARHQRASKARGLRDGLLLKTWQAEGRPVSSARSFGCPPGMEPISLGGDCHPQPLELQRLLALSAAEFDAPSPRLPGHIQGTLLEMRILSRLHEEFRRSSRRSSHRKTGREPCRHSRVPGCVSHSEGLFSLRCCAFGSPARVRASALWGELRGKRNWKTCFDPDGELREHCCYVAPSLCRVGEG